MICEHDGDIYHARKRISWPGEAAVVVSILHISNGTVDGVKVLDGRKVDSITAFLFHTGGHIDPERLKANESKSFIGMYLRGMGFSFDDTNTDGVAARIAEMRRLVESNVHNAEAIFPFIGGAEVNNSPTHAHHRYAINFFDYPLWRRESAPDDFRDRVGGPVEVNSLESWSVSTQNLSVGSGSEKQGDRSWSWAQATEDQRRHWRSEGTVPLDYPDPVAADWPDLLAIVEQRVKPFREQLGASALDCAHKARWWRYANDRPQLCEAIAGLKRVLACAIVSNKICFAFLPTQDGFLTQIGHFPVPELLGTMRSAVERSRDLGEVFQLHNEGRHQLFAFGLL